MARGCSSPIWSIIARFSTSRLWSVIEMRWMRCLGYAAAQCCFCTLPIGLLCSGCGGKAGDQPASFNGPKISIPVQSTATTAPLQDDERRRADELLSEADAFSKSGDLQAAIKRYGEVIASVPDRSDAYARRGDTLLATSAVNAALADYEEAIRISPDDAGLYLKRASIDLLGNKFDLALADCNKAVRLEPKSAEAFLTRGNIHFQTGRIDACLADYDAAIRLSTNPAVAYNNRGAAYRQKGDLDKALADYTAALTHNAQFADAYNNRGDVHARQGKLDEAVADFSEAIRISPFELQAYENRADVYFHQKKSEQAVANYTEIIQQTLKMAAVSSLDVRPGAKLARIYRKRSSALLSLERFDEALADADEAVSLNPEDADTYLLRSQIHLKKRQFSASDADRHRAAQVQLRQLPGTAP